MRINSYQIERILLVRLSALGDCVNAIPVFHALRKAYPKAHLAWVVQDHNAPLLQNLPGLDELIIFPRKRWKTLKSWRIKAKEARRFIRHLRMRRFEMAIDVQSNTKSSVIAYLSEARQRIGHGKGEGKELSLWFNNVKVLPQPEVQSIFLRNLHLLSILGIEQPEVDFTLPVNKLADAHIEKWLAQQGLDKNRYILFIPFCSRDEKEWGDSSFAQLGENLMKQDRKAVILHGPGQFERAKSMILPSSKDNVFLGPPTTIPEMVELIRNSRLVVGGDTGPSQIAGALNKQIIALYGPTDPKRTGMWGRPHYLKLDATPDDVTALINTLAPLE